MTKSNILVLSVVRYIQLAHVRLAMLALAVTLFSISISFQLTRAQQPASPQSAKSAPAKTDEVIALVSGKPISRELGGDETHAGDIG